MKVISELNEISFLEHILYPLGPIWLIFHSQHAIGQKVYIDFEKLCMLRVKVISNTLGEESAMTLNWLKVKYKGHGRFVFHSPVLDQNCFLYLAQIE